MPSFFLTPASKGKRIVLWALASFAVSQLVLSIYLDKRRLETRDPLYGYRLHSLQTRLAQSPNAPLFLILGSSRVKLGVSPSAMTLPALPGEATPIVYNFGINGMGTIRELIYLRRLLADGIRPKWLLVEIWPPLWAEAGFFREERMVACEDDLHWRDLPLVWRYFQNNRPLLQTALRKSCLPLRSYRDRLLLAFFAPQLLSREKRYEMKRCVRDSSPSDPDGWFPWPLGPITPKSVQEGLHDGEDKLKPLLENLQLDLTSDSALRELLDICRRNGIKTGLILLPEHSWARGWYSLQTRTLVRDYLRRLGHDYPVPIVDARAWQSDDHFADSCHIAGEAGVRSFSTRLGRDVVRPLIEDRPLDPNILFAECRSQSP